jgi:hypothetical protein
VAVAAACLGFVTAALAAFFSAVELLVVWFGGGPLWRPAVGLACFAGFVIGGCLLLLRRSRWLLIVSGLVWTVLWTTVSLTEPELRMDGTAGLVVFLLPTLAPPLLAAVLAAVPRVRDWLADPAG